MERTKFKNWKDTLLEVHKICSFHEFEMILDSEKRSTYDELYFFKRGIKMAYRQEGYEESWIELLLKMIDVRVYRADDFDIAEHLESYREFEDWIEREYERSQEDVDEDEDLNAPYIYEDYGARMDRLLGG